MLYTITIVLLVIISLGLIGVVLIQKDKGGGLSGSFGTGEGQAVFGSRAGDVLTYATTWFAILFMVLCLVATYVSKHADESLMRGGRTPAPGRTSRIPTITLEEREAMEREEARSVDSDQIENHEMDMPHDDTDTIPEDIW